MLCDRGARSASRASASAVSMRARAALLVVCAAACQGRPASPAPRPDPPATTIGGEHDREGARVDVPLESRLTFAGAPCVRAAEDAVYCWSRGRARPAAWYSLAPGGLIAGAGQVCAVSATSAACVAVIGDEPEATTGACFVRRGREWCVSASHGLTEGARTSVLARESRTRGRCEARARLVSCGRDLATPIDDPVQLCALGLLCARDRDGRVACADRDSGPAALVDLPLPAVDVETAGFGAACAALADGSVHCWGEGMFGALGRGTYGGDAAPAPLPGISSAVEVDGNCALLADGRVMCWGLRGLGPPPLPAAAIPALVPALRGAVALGFSERWTCAALERAPAELVCIGPGAGLGLGRSLDAIGEVGVRDLEVPITDIRHECLAAGDRAGYLHSVSLTHPGVEISWSRPGESVHLDERRIRCVSLGGRATLGPAITALDGTSPPIAPGTVAGEFGVCRLEGGEVVCELSIGQFASRDSGVHPQRLADGVRVDTSGVHACAIRRDGTVWCTGWGSHGELDGTPVEVSAFIEVPPARGARAVAVTRGLSCVITRDRHVMCWGDWGTGPQAPTVMPNLDRVERLWAGDSALGSGACARVRGGDVYCWGMTSAVVEYGAPSPVEVPIPPPPAALP